MLYFHTITQGILFGLTLALMAGPAFFALIQTSVSKGFRVGSQLALGISLSDIIMVFVAWYGLSSFFDTPKAQNILTIAGGVVLLAFGVYTAFKRHSTIPNSKDIKIQLKFHYKYFLKGFLFNIANPGIWMFWFLPVGIASSHPTVELQITFLSSILITVFVTDLLKCAIANELKRFMTDNVITYLNRIIGSILVLFGIYLIATLFLDVTPIVNNIKN